jgi:hypothetical protein
VPRPRSAACWDSSASSRTSSATNGEAAALLARAGGLDRGVQREEVRLVLDRRDRPADPGDLL